MADRVAVYVDFDNVVISRYDRVHGKSAWHQDDARTRTMHDARLAEAKVDLGAIIDFATSFGVVAMTRAYADWSVPANAAYRKDLVDKAVDLVQLFAASGTKNGADIRLAVDAVEDLTRHPDLTHVVLVAGDSDYVPLAQRCKRLGRTFVGIGVAGSTSSALVSACDEFAQYEQLPGVIAHRPDVAAVEPNLAAGPTKVPERKATAKKSTSDKAAASMEPPALKHATDVLVRAIRVGLQKSDEEWLYAAGVKSQMQRMDPAFNEKALGFATFRAFVESRSAVVDSKIVNNNQQMRLR